MFPDHGSDVHTLTKNADMAMYLAKEDGKNNFRFFTKEVKMQSIERLTLENCLRHALSRNEFSLHYQPKVDLATGQITGVEALLRWTHAEHGMLPPGQFIPLAEETGLIVPIGRWALREACAQNMAWQRRGLRPVSMAVNLSPRQFSDENLLQDIDEALAASGMSPALLQIEVTESMMMRNVARAIKVLDEIQSRGIRIAIDDFGTGYSSMSLMKQFPIDTIKIDRSFVRDLPDDTEDRAIAQAIINMGRALGMTIVAEGVETVEQETFLRAHGCDEMQGFLFSRPLPSDQIGRSAAASAADGGAAAATGGRRRSQAAGPTALKTAEIRPASRALGEGAMRGLEWFALNGKFPVHGSSVWSPSEASITPAPAATSEPSGNPRLAHHSAGICLSAVQRFERRAPPPCRGRRSLVFRNGAPSREFVHDAFKGQIRRLTHRGLQSFRLLDLGRRRRAFAHDQQYGVFILGAIPMHLFAEMRHKAAGGHRGGAVFRIEFRTGAHPPGALQDLDVAVVRMEVRVAEMVSLGPFVVDDVEAGLGRIAHHHRDLRAGRIDRAPRNLVRQFVDHGGRIEFGGGTDAQHAGERQRQQKIAPKPVGGFHSFLPEFPRLRRVGFFFMGAC